MIVEPLLRPGLARLRAIRHQTGWALGTLCFLGLLEVYGRWVTSDVGDVAGVLGLFVLMVATSVRHSRQSVPWWGWLGRQASRLLRLVGRLDVQVGLDLRETPPYERGWPRPTLVSFFALAATVLALAALGPWMPGGLRWIGVRTSYSLYLVALSLLWAAHIFVVHFLGELMISTLRDAITRRQAVSDMPPLAPPRAVVSVVMIVLFAAVVAAPPIWAIAGLLTLVAAHFVIACLPNNPPLLLMSWSRRAGRDSAPRTIPWTWFVALEPARIALALLVLVLISSGATVLGVRPQVEGMPVTAFLGRALAWIGSAGIASVSLFLLHRTLLAHRLDPAKPRLPVVQFEGTEVATHTELAARFADEGFAVPPHGAQPARSDLRVTVAPESETLCWPPEGGRIKASELLAPDAPARLKRRHDIVQRRLLIRGLERLFKHAARRTFEKGSGLWVVPQHWFSTGLCRDVDETSGGSAGGTLEQTIGPHYHQVIPIAARHHFHGVMRGVGIDVMFVEDGVDFRRFRRVLRVLFEVYDIHGGERPVRELDFVGLPGTCVLILEFSPDSGFEVEGYPEPDYEGLGRGRVLHVFKDRGGEDERVHADPPREREPVLA